MNTLARGMALGLAFSVVLAGCNNVTDKPQTEAKTAKKTQTAVNDAPKPQPEAKPAQNPQGAVNDAPKPQPVSKDAAKSPVETKTPGPDAKAAAKAADDSDEEFVKMELAKLNPEDRKQAEAQRYCAIENDHRLGGMGVPVKVMVQGKPVFLCCGSCKKQALADPQATLAKVEELKKKAASETK